MDATPTIDDMKSLVFGLGRGAGIKIIPGHYAGDYGTQIRNLAQDVVNATKTPLDDVSSSIQQHAIKLKQLLDSDADANAITNGLSQYIRSRVQWLGRDAVE